MMKHLTLLLLACVLFAGCKKENPYVDPVPTTPAVTAANVAFIFGNDVYYMTDINGSATRITNTASQAKTKLRMSHDHSRFAYLNANGTIEIVDAQGNLLNTLTQFTSVNDFNWDSSDSTLYVLSNNQIQYFGPSMGLPSITYPNVPFTANKYVVSMSVSADNDLVYVVQYEDFSAGIGSVLVIKPHTGGNPITRDLNDPFRRMSYVRFSKQGTGFVLGYYGVSSGNPNLMRLELFNSLTATPTRVLESSEEYDSPVYRSDLNLIVGGYQGASTSSLVVAMRDLAATPGVSVSLNSYSEASGPLSVDWK